MSSFQTPHQIYLFAMTNGKRKAGYGPDPDGAFENLKLRLTADEIALVKKDEFLRVSQREFRKHLHELG